MNDKG
jgi:hypothetical protein